MSLQQAWNDLPEYHDNFFIINPLVSGIHGHGHGLQLY